MWGELARKAKLGAARKKWHDKNTEKVRAYNESRKDSRREYHKVRYAQNLERYTDSHLRNEYGITLADVQRMYEEQDGKCSVCCRAGVLRFREERTKKEIRLVVDHCHATGRVRGLLCDRCNTLLGMAQDDKALLRRAIKYLSAGGNHESAE